MKLHELKPVSSLVRTDSQKDFFDRLEREAAEEDRTGVRPGVPAVSTLKVTDRRGGHTNEFEYRVGPDGECRIQPRFGANDDHMGWVGAD